MYNNFPKRVVWPFDQPEQKTQVTKCETPKTIGQAFMAFMAVYPSFPPLRSKVLSNVNPVGATFKTSHVFVPPRCSVHLPLGEGGFLWINFGRLIEKIKDQVSADEAGKAFGMMEDLILGDFCWEFLKKVDFSKMWRSKIDIIDIWVAVSVVSNILYFSIGLKLETTN